MPHIHTQLLTRNMHKCLQNWHEKHLTSCMSPQEIESDVRTAFVMLQETDGNFVIYGESDITLCQVHDTIHVVCKDSE